MIVVAHNIRSLHNVGSILRNAAAFGVEKVWCTGYTAVPPRKEIAKVSLGAEDLVPWEHGDIGEVIARLQSDGYRVLGLETGEDAVDIGTIATTPDPFPRNFGTSLPRRGVAIVLGNEVEGIDAETRTLLDGIVEIPMQKKRSLNVSVASGIAMYMLRTK